jgi:acetyl-CoA carboxylase biotin carboxyl carrier protein
MNLDRIKQLIDLVAGASIAELVIEEHGVKVRIVRDKARDPASAAPSPALAPVTAPPAAPLAAEARQPVLPAPELPTIVTAPLYGVFHRTPSPEAPAFVEVGAMVEAGQSLCLIEAMKVFNAITAQHAGRVAEILVQGGQEVAQGQPLFRLE